MPALLSPATPGPQPGLRSRSAREGASLYYLSASLGTWPLSSQPGMEPVPPALRQWRLSHRTPGRPRRRSSVSARWVARCPQALRVLCSHACGCGCPPRRVLGDGVPTSPAPHSPAPARGPRLCPRARLRAWPRVLGPEPGPALYPLPSVNPTASLELPGWPRALSSLQQTPCPARLQPLAQAPDTQGPSAFLCGFVFQL